MKKIAFGLMMVLTFLVCAPVSAATKTVRAIVTFYWPGEAGGRYDCDGDKLHKGIAAVDFDVFPKGTVLNLSNRFTVIAKDCGGRAIISRKAAHERGVHCPVIDVWVRSEYEARNTENKLPSIVLVTYDPNSRHPVAIIRCLDRQMFASD